MGERLLVHVGYSHAREAVIVREDGYESAWMAARLKALTGIDPLTIAQTVCGESSTETSLPQAPEGKVGWFDILVDHPLESFVQGRVRWRLYTGDQLVAIPPELRPADTPVFVEAWAAGEPFEAVPMDRVFAQPDEDVALSLPCRALCRARGSARRAIGGTLPGARR